jgi:hypothetical protein
MAEEARVIVAKEEIGVRIGAIAGISPVSVHS